MLHPCGTSQSETNLVDWWSIMGSKANQTYAVAQLLQSPSPQNINSESNERNNSQQRKRDKLRSWWPWKKTATETAAHSVNTPESSGASLARRKQSTPKTQRSTFFVRLRLSRNKRSIDLRSPCNLGPGVCTTKVCAVNTSRV